MRPGAPLAQKYVLCKCVDPDERLSCPRTFTNKHNGLSSDEFGHALLMRQADPDFTFLYCGGHMGPTSAFLRALKTEEVSKTETVLTYPSIPECGVKIDAAWDWFLKSLEVTYFKNYKTYEEWQADKYLTKFVVLSHSKPLTELSLKGRTYRLKGMYAGEYSYIANHGRPLSKMDADCCSTEGVKTMLFECEDPRHSIFPDRYLLLSLVIAAVLIIAIVGIVLYMRQQKLAAEEESYF